MLRKRRGITTYAALGDRLPRWQRWWELRGADDATIE